MMNISNYFKKKAFYAYSDFISAQAEEQLNITNRCDRESYK